MKTKSKKIFLPLFAAVLIAVLVFSFAACGKTNQSNENGNGTGAIVDETTGQTTGDTASSEQDDDYSYVSDLETAVTITCVSGTENAYVQTENANGTTTITFTTVSEDTVYSISGTLNGNIVIDADESETYKFDLELSGLTVQSAYEAPIVALSGNKVTIVAKKDTENYIYDNRDAVSDDDISASVYSAVDLDVQGKGYLWITSKNNNGIHGKDDVEVKNLTLYVNCADNALKGNDSVTVTGEAVLTLIATAGDGIKTSNSDVSSKGNQKGTVTLEGGTIDIYAATDGIDAAYDVVISGESVNLTIHTDKYSSYSSEVTAVADGTYYIRSTTTSYSYSIRYYNSTTGAEKWVNSSSYKTVSSGGGRGGFGGRSSSTYYYYTMEKPSGYDQMSVYVYSSTQSQGQTSSYVSTVTTSINDSYDTIAYNGSSFSWTNYTTQQSGFGPGGMNDGNTDKSDYSTKGIKAYNEIVITNGTVTITSYDDAIHANNDSALENGETPLGNVTVSGGTLTLYSNDDGIHADGTLTISGGTIKITNSYEGLEGSVTVVSGGNTTVRSSDDGVNGTGSTGTDLYIKGGYLYVYAGGDGLDTNSTTSYSGISFEGGTTVVISTSSGNSCIDSERGYKYSGGTVLAVCPTGMTSECEMCQNFSSVAVKTTKSLTSGTYITVGGEIAVKMPTSINNGYIVYLSGSSNKTISTSSSVSYTLDNNGVYVAK